FQNCPPNNITDNTDQGQCFAIVNFPTPIAADSNGTVAVVQTEGPSSGEEFPVGPTDVVFEATGANGNTVRCSFTVTVVDKEKPQFLNSCEENYYTGGFEVTEGFTVPDFSQTFAPVDN